MTLVEVLSPFGSTGPAASLSESTTVFVVLQNHIVAVATALGDAVANDLVHVRYCVNGIASLSVLISIF